MAARIMQFIVLERGFEGARLNTGTMSDPPTLAATHIDQVCPGTNPAMQGPLYKLKHRLRLLSRALAGHGRNAQYIVRLDGPVDHAQSRLEILRDGHVVQHLNPLLDSADVLFASAPAPKPGHYVPHWIVKSVPDHDASEGMIPFSVAQ
jgi:hypothetical protein